MKRWMIRVIALVLCLSIIQPTIGQAEETLDLNGRVTGEISDSQKQQLYKVVVPKRGLLFFDLKSWIDLVDYRVMDEDGKEFIDYTLHSDALTPKTKTLFYDLEAGIYYFEVNQWSEGHNGKFELKTSFTSYDTNDQEPNNGTEQAQTLAFGKKLKGYISYQDENDVYRVTLPKAGLLKVDVSSLIYGNAEVYVRDSSNREIRNKIIMSDGRTPAKYSTSVNLEAGIYYVEVEGWDPPDTTGLYDIMASFTPVNNQEKEPNNGTTQAMPLSFYKPLTGFLSWNDTEDFYKISLPKSSTVTLDLQSMIDSNSVLELYDRNFKVVHEAQISSSSRTPKKYSKSLKLSAGTYYVAVKAWDERRDTGKYILQVKSSHLLPPLSVNAISSRSTAITGKTEKYANMTFKIGKKTYKRKADAKGNYVFKMKQQRAGSVIQVTSKNKYGTTTKRVTVKR